MRATWLDLVIPAAIWLGTIAAGVLLFALEF